MIQYIFFDVVGTLLGKPSMFEKIQNTLSDFGYSVALEEIKNKHKLLSEVIYFPDRTDATFYKKFNSDLIYLFGILPSDELVNAVFNNCTYLPWEAFEDTVVLNDFKLPLGVISNFNSTLKEKLDAFFGPIFSDVFVSEDQELAKPNIEFYKRALDKVPYQANEVLYVGDSIKLDLEPAEKLGLKVLIVDRDYFYPNLRNRISSLEEIKNYL